MMAYCKIGSIGTSISEIWITEQKCSLTEVILNTIHSLNVLEYISKDFGLSKYYQS